MGKRLHNYISDVKILWMVEDQDMTYPEIVEDIHDNIGVKFNKETIGRHYRDFREELEEKYYASWDKAVKYNFGVDPAVQEEDENVISKKCKECGRWYDIKEGYPPEKADFCSISCYDDYQLKQHGINTEDEPEEISRESVLKFFGVPESKRNNKSWYQKFKEWLFAWAG